MPGFALNGIGDGLSTKAIFPSIISIYIFLSFPQTLSKIATGNKELRICVMKGHGFNFRK